MSDSVVEEQWAVDMGFTIQRVNNEAAALTWVQSYRDHPEALEGDPMPVAVRRTVTTTAWEPRAQHGERAWPPDASSEPAPPLSAG